MLKFLIICPLVFLAGFVDAVAGGGGLISLPAYVIAGLPIHNAIATNKLSSSMGTALTTVRFALRGFIPWKQAVLCVIAAYLGSTGGARLALLVSDHYFRILMLFILPCTAFYITRTHALNEEQAPFSARKTLLISLGAALIIGLYDGFYGPGTGTFLILLLTGLAHMKLSQANGTAKAINLATNLAALVVYLLNGKVLLLLGLAAGCFGLAGNYIGSRCFEKGGSKIVKPLMLTVLVIFFIKVVYELFTGAA